MCTGMSVLLCSHVQHSESECGPQLLPSAEGGADEWACGRPSLCPFHQLGSPPGQPCRHLRLPNHCQAGPCLWCSPPSLHRLLGGLPCSVLHRALSAGILSLRLSWSLKIAVSRFRFLARTGSFSPNLNCKFWSPDFKPSVSAKCKDVSKKAVLNLCVCPKQSWAGPDFDADMLSFSSICKYNFDSNCCLVSFPW